MGLGAAGVVGAGVAGFEEKNDEANVIDVARKINTTIKLNRNLDIILLQCFQDDFKSFCRKDTCE